MTRICWKCQRPGALMTNARGEPAHRECLQAYPVIAEQRDELNLNDHTQTNDRI